MRQYKHDPKARKKSMLITAAASRFPDPFRPTPTIIEEEMKMDSSNANQPSSFKNDDLQTNRKIQNEETEQTPADSYKFEDEDDDATRLKMDSSNK